MIAKTPRGPAGRKRPEIAFFLFSGPSGPGPSEQLVDGARRAAAADLLTLVCETGVFNPVVLVTPELDSVRPLPANVTVTSGPSLPGGFHLGNSLVALVTDGGIERVLCAGAGAGVLMSSNDLRTLASPLIDRVAVVVANNLYSADMVGVTPASLLATHSDLPADDNGLAFHLWRTVGLTGVEPTRTAATQFDIDDPSDVLVATLHPGTGPNLRSYLDSVDLDTTRIRMAARVFTQPNSTAVVAGRISSATWAFLERETACRTRIFAEERGMRALELEHSARSLVAMHYDAVGPEAFMRHLAELGDAAFIDTRVILAHKDSRASREDRFLSDLGRWQEIKDEYLRDITAAALAAPIPVVLGGHSLVAGGLMALIEAGWSERERSKTAGEVHDANG